MPLSAIHCWTILSTDCSTFYRLLITQPLSITVTNYKPYLVTTVSSGQPTSPNNCKFNSGVKQNDLEISVCNLIYSFQILFKDHNCLGLGYYWMYQWHILRHRVQWNISYLSFPCIGRLVFRQARSSLLITTVLARPVHLFLLCVSSSQCSTVVFLPRSM